MAPTRRARPSTSDPGKRTSLIWLAAREYDAVRPFWQDNYIWSPVPVDASIPIEHTSFIEVGSGGPDAMLSTDPGEPPRSTWAADAVPTAIGPTCVAGAGTPDAASHTVVRPRGEPGPGGSDVASDAPWRRHGGGERRRRRPARHVDDMAEQAAASDHRCQVDVRRSHTAKAKFACKLSMNLEMEIELKAHIQGTLLLELL